MSGFGRPKPIPILVGTPSTRSTPKACCSKIRATVRGDSSFTPRTSPSQATADCTSATECALPWPFSAPRSACRHAAVQLSRGSSTGLVNILWAGVPGGIADISNAAAGGTTFATRWNSEGARPM